MKKTSAQMIEELESALSDPTVTKMEYVRIQAVLLRKKQYPRQETSEIVGKSIHAIEDWVTGYNTRGIEGLRTRVRQTQPRSKLSLAQRAKLVSLLKKKPRDVKIGVEEYWTMGAVKQLVKKETGLIYQSINSYRKLLEEANMSYQKVEFVDKHQKQESHDEFKKQFETKVKGGRISMWW